MSAKVWYVAVGKKKAGPMTSDRLRRQVSVGKLPGAALAWRDGMDGWEPVGDIDHLQPVEGADLGESSNAAEIEAPPVEAPRKRRSSSGKTKTGSKKATKSKGKLSRSGVAKAKSTPSKPKRAAASVDEDGFQPLYRLGWKDMFQAFGLGLEFGRIKLALAGMLMPFAALVLLGALAVGAAQLSVILALPILFAAGGTAYVLTMVSVGALSYHAKHQLLELERPTVKEALSHALQNAAPLSVPPFLLSMAWLLPLIVLGVLALMVKIPYLGPIGTGALFGVHIALGGLTLFLMLAAGVSAAFGPVAAAFEGSSVKGTLNLILSFAKRSLVRTTLWGYLPSVLFGPFSMLVGTVALLILVLPLGAVFASVGPETIDWLGDGGVGDAPYPGALLMVALIAIWVGFVGVVVSAVLGSVHNSLISLLYVGGREGNDSQISRDTYLARNSEGQA